jgi:hypothetical protein
MSSSVIVGVRVVPIFLLFSAWASVASAQNYRLERIASGLAQPTYLAQAPGDPDHIVYYSTRITAANGTGGGFGGLKNMGGIFRYDMNTRTSTQVMSLAHRQLTGDEGLVGFAFNPDFNTPGAPGYQKMYVSSSQFTSSSTSPIDRVEEYLVSGRGGVVLVDGMGQPIVNRTILQYTHVNTQQNHTVNWVGFDPRASSMPVGSPERNYLFISTGDGDLGGSARNRPEQKASDVRGKILRVDVDAAHGDAYGGRYDRSNAKLRDSADKPHPAVERGQSRQPARRYVHQLHVGGADAGALFAGRSRNLLYGHSQHVSHELRPGHWRLVGRRRG